MPIVAWSYCRGPFEKKLAALGTLSPDLAVIPKALQPDQESAQVPWFPSSALLGPRPPRPAAAGAHTGVSLSWPGGSARPRGSLAPLSCRYGYTRVLPRLRGLLARFRRSPPRDRQTQAFLDGRHQEPDRLPSSKGLRLGVDPRPVFARVARSSCSLSCFPPPRSFSSLVAGRRACPGEVHAPFGTQLSRGPRRGGPPLDIRGLGRSGVTTLQPTAPPRRRGRGEWS